MKKKRLLLFLLLLCICGIAFSFYYYKENVPSPENALSWLTKNQMLISHAGGGIWQTQEDGSQKLITYSNSREAMYLSISNGYQVIEFDLMVTTDNDLACTHAWPGKEKRQRSSEEWRKYTVKKHYTSLLFRDVLQTMMEYPDLYIITDTKSSHTAEDTQNEFSLVYQQAL